MARKKSKMASKLDQTPDSSSSSSLLSSSTASPSSALSSLSHALSDVLRASHRRLLQLPPRPLDSTTQYDALPVGAAGAYDPAADEIDYTYHQHGRHNRRRLLYQQLLGPGDDNALDEVGGRSGGPGGGSRRKNHVRGLTSADTADLTDPEGEVGLEEGELSTDTLYLFLLVFASSAFSMWAAYLALT